MKKRRGGRGLERVNRIEESECGVERRGGEGADEYNAACTPSVLLELESLESKVGTSEPPGLDLEK